MSFCCDPYLHQVKGEKPALVSSDTSHLKAKQLIIIVPILFWRTKNEQIHDFITFVCFVNLQAH